MGEYDEDQEHGVEPARPPLTAARAREMTAGLREAMDDVRRSVAVLAARVRDAHAARVWLPLGHSSWESYCDAEFGISRALAVDTTVVARLYGAAREGCDDCREDSLEQLCRNPGQVAALALWACTRVMDTFNDLPMEMLERGEPAFRQLARAYSNSTFRHGFDARELTDLHETCQRLDPHTLQPAAERALQLLLSDPADPALFGSLTGAYTPGDEDDAQDYTLTHQVISPEEVVITLTPHGD